MNDRAKLVLLTTRKGYGFVLIFSLSFVLAAAILLLPGREALAQEANGASSASLPQGIESEQDLAAPNEALPAPAETPEPSVEPVYQESAYQEPVYEEPAYQEPAYEEPSYEYEPTPATEPEPMPPSEPGIYPEPSYAYEPEPVPAPEPYPAPAPEPQTVPESAAPGLEPYPDPAPEPVAEPEVPYGLPPVGVEPEPVPAPEGVEAVYEPAPHTEPVPAESSLAPEPAVEPVPEPGVGLLPEDLGGVVEEPAPLRSEPASAPAAETDLQPETAVEPPPVFEPVVRETHYVQADSEVSAQPATAAAEEEPVTEIAPKTPEGTAALPAIGAAEPFEPTAVPPPSPADAPAIAEPAAGDVPGPAAAGTMPPASVPPSAPRPVSGPGDGGGEVVAGSSAPIELPSSTIEVDAASEPAFEPEDFGLGSRKSVAGGVSFEPMVADEAAWVAAYPLDSLAGGAVAFLSERIAGFATALVEAAGLSEAGGGRGRSGDIPMPDPPIVPPRVPPGPTSAKILVSGSSDEDYAIPLGVLVSVLLLPCGAKLLSWASDDLLEPESALAQAAERPG